MPKRHMTLESIRIENLRAFADETIEMSDYTALVGANGAGKSTVLFALNVFFRNIRGLSTNPISLSKEDFHLHNTSRVIKITLQFGDLSETAEERLEHYVRQGKFILSAKAELEKDQNAALVKHFGTRLVIPDFAEYFKAKDNKAKVDELRPLYQRIMTQYPELPSVSTGKDMWDALRGYEESHPELCEPLESESHFFGVSKGADRLDDLIQWVYVPAVLDASTEESEGKNTALGELLRRTVRASMDFTSDLETIRSTAMNAYESLMNAQSSVLEAISGRLTKKLQRIAHPATTLKLAWADQPESAVKIAEPFAQAKVSEFELEPHGIGRCGHGLQRAYLLAVLQELSYVDAEEGPVLLLGIEEPELYQHPPQARHLAGTIRDLTAGNAQVIVTTHSPYFISAVDFESVRTVRRQGPKKEVVVTGTSFEAISARIANASGKPPVKPAGVQAKLQTEFSTSIAEMFFSPALVLVEGLEDEAYLKSHAILFDYWEEMRKLGIGIIPAHGKGHMYRPIAIALELQIPIYIVFDSDGGEKDKERQAQHRFDNTTLLGLLGAESDPPFPSKDAIGATYTAWNTDIAESVKMDFASEDYDKWVGAARKAVGHVKDVVKNPLFIAELLATAAENGGRSACLDMACERIIEFGRASEARKSGGEEE